MTAHIRNEPALSLLYSVPRDYQGEFLPAVAEIRPTLRLLSYQRHGNGLQVEVMDGDTVRQFHAEHADHGELMRLGDCDRATLQGALILVRGGELRPEVGDAA